MRNRKSESPTYLMLFRVRGLHLLSLRRKQLLWNLFCFLDLLAAKLFLRISWLSCCVIMSLFDLPLCCSTTCKTCFGLLPRCHHLADSELSTGFEKDLYPCYSSGCFLVSLALKLLLTVDKQRRFGFTWYVSQWKVAFCSLIKPQSWCFSQKTCLANRFLRSLMTAFCCVSDFDDLMHSYNLLVVLKTQYYYFY